MERTPVDQLIIEITRKCNMACDHCLRGDPENVVIDPEYINEIMSQVSSIGMLTITGGEPSLHPEIILDIVEAARHYGVDISNFYMVTNAKKVTETFSHAVMKLYWYCSDNDVSQLAISNDAYHDILDDDNVKMLQSFSFTTFKSENQEEYNNFLIGEGRAVENYYTTRIAETGSYEVDEWGISGDEIYLNALGNLVSNCNLSYETQDNDKEFFIGDVKEENFNLLESVKKYIEKTEVLV